MNCIFFLNFQQIINVILFSLNYDLPSLKESCSRPTIRANKEILLLPKIDFFKNLYLMRIFRMPIFLCSILSLDIHKNWYDYEKITFCCAFHICFWPGKNPQSSFKGKGHQVRGLKAPFLINKKKTFQISSASIWNRCVKVWKWKLKILDRVGKMVLKFTQNWWWATPLAKLALPWILV